MKTKFDKYINFILIFMVLATTSLVVAEIQSPGFCPPYPILRIPACMVMLAYFLIMLLGQNMKGKIGKYVFLIPTIIAISSATYFSYNEIMDLGHCPSDSER